MSPPLTGVLSMNDGKNLQELDIQLIPVERLFLDSANPRLPERLLGESQSEILKFLYEQGVLEELAQSYLDNGFFQHEPMIVLREDDHTFVVAEGNRRLSALKILHGFPEADDLHFTGINPSAEHLRRLREIPCFLASDRNQIHAFTGFRHIGGIKTWQPEAKARYLLAEVQRLSKEGVTDLFKELGRRVGSNAQGVRNPYLAIRILIYAREEFGLQVTQVQEDRFGVWLRCMNSADIRKYIGLSQARTYQEIEETVKEIDQNKLAEVLGDLQKKEPFPAVLRDSREVTSYGRVLSHARARQVLRKTRDLSLAKQIIDELDLEGRVWRLADSVTLIMETLHRTTISNDLLEALEELFQRARSSRDIAKSRMDDRDNES